MSNRRQILVVDDHGLIQEFITEVLGDEGYAVTTAASGEEALEIFRQQVFPLVLTDIHMGGLSGFDVLEEIRRIAPETAVIIMSSDASPEHLDRAKNAGAADFLAKPFTDLDLLCEVVERAYAGVKVEPVKG